MQNQQEIQERKNFLSAKDFADPNVKREEFSISLRKKKKNEIMQQKRKRIMAKNHQINHTTNDNAQDPISLIEQYLMR